MSFELGSLVQCGDPAKSFEGSATARLHRETGCEEATAAKANWGRVGVVFDVRWFWLNPKRIVRWVDIAICQKSPTLFLPNGMPVVLHNCSMAPEDLIVLDPVKVLGVDPYREAEPSALEPCEQPVGPVEGATQPAKPRVTGAVWLVNAGPGSGRKEATPEPAVADTATGGEAQDKRPTSSDKLGALLQQMVQLPSKEALLACVAREIEYPSKDSPKMTMSATCCGFCVSELSTGNWYIRRPAARQEFGVRLDVTVAELVSVVIPTCLRWFTHSRQDLLQAGQASESDSDIVRTIQRVGNPVDVLAILALSYSVLDYSECQKFLGEFFRALDLA